MALRRRSAAERRVLEMVRSGKDIPVPARKKRAGAAYPIDCGDFGLAALRDAASGAGLDIQPADCPFLSPDELLLLGWLAQAQRSTTVWLVAPRHASLRLAIIRSAAAFDAAGLRLASSAIYAARSAMETGRPDLI